ncbi:MAG: porin [Opitutaceae bacterium]|jgi:phosphate-selective porin OprO/OprP
MRTLHAILRAAFILPVLFAGLGSAHAEDTASEIAALREQIRLLDQKLRVLERKQELKDEEAAAKAKTQVAVSASASGFGITSNDKAFDLKFRLLAQVDGRFFIGDDVPANSTFLVRRLRPILQGTVYGIYDFNVTPDFAGGTATTSSPSLYESFVAARFSPQFVVKAGKFASPVALEPGGNRHFIESPFVNSLLPNRDIGIEVSGTTADGALVYQLGVFNGARNNTTSFAVDAEDEKSVAGRLTAYPFKSIDGAVASLGLAVGFSIGNEEGSPQSIVTNSQQPLLSFGTLTGDGSHKRVSPSIFWYTGPFSAVAEYAWENQDYRRSPAVIFSGTNTAWRATVGYVLTGEESTPKGVTPKTSFDLSSGAWGAFEIAARVSSINLADELFTSTLGNLSATANARGATAYGLAFNWYLNRILRAQLSYEYTSFDGGGAGTLKHDENAVLSRLQLSF